MTYLPLIGRLLSPHYGGAKETGFYGRAALSIYFEQEFPMSHGEVSDQKRIDKGSKN